MSNLSAIFIAKFLTLEYCEWTKIDISKETIDTVMVLTFQGRVTINRKITVGLKYCLKHFFPTSSESESI